MAFGVVFGVVSGVAFGVVFGVVFGVGNNHANLRGNIPCQFLIYLHISLLMRIRPFVRASLYS